MIIPNIMLIIRIKGSHIEQGLLKSGQPSIESQRGVEDQQK